MKLRHVIIAAQIFILGCVPAKQLEPPPEDCSAKRIELLESQLISARKTEKEWGTWCETLIATRPSDGIQSMLCNDALVAKFLEPTRKSGPLPAIVDFARQLYEAKVDLLIVFVPLRAAVYPALEMKDVPVPSGGIPLLDWRYRHLYLALERSGVEVLDLLPTYLKQREGVLRDSPRGPHSDPIFTRGSSYWTSYGVSITADLIGARIRRYPWFEQAAQQMGRAVVQEQVVWKGGSKNQFMSRVFIEGEAPDLYPDIGHVYDQASPVLLLGDSYTRKHTDLQAGLPDQLLRTLGFRVDVVAVDSGTPRMSRKALALREDPLQGKRLVVYVIPCMWIGEKQINSWEKIDIGIRTSASAVAP